MKIAIYETVHLDWVLPLCELFGRRSDEVSIFTNIDFREDIEAVQKHQFNRFTWHFADPEAGVRTFYRQLRQFFTTDRFDVILLNSVDARHLVVYAALRNQTRAKVLINIHDIRNFFMHPFRPELRSLIRSAGKKILQQRADGFLVNARAMKEYMEAHQLTKKPVFWLSPVIEKATVPTTGGEFLHVVVPGSIDERRRDYDFVLDAVEAVHTQVPGRIHLTFAGRPVGDYGSRIIGRMQELGELGIPTAFSEDEIRETKFQEIIASASVLLSPLRIKTSIRDATEEMYGLTKCSGNIYDAIRHGRPLVLPAGVRPPEEIVTSCLHYDSIDSLQEILLQMAQEPGHLATLTIRAVENSGKFSFEKISHQLAEMLDAITK
ncbi:MAG TPA: glycosyltransferase [Flavisolibacter sp.]